jgi:hypothetical protein
VAVVRNWRTSYSWLGRSWLCQCWIRDEGGGHSTLLVLATSHSSSVGHVGNLSVFAHGQGNNLPYSRLTSCYQFSDCVVGFESLLTASSGRSGCSRAEAGGDCVGAELGPQLLLSHVDTPNRGSTHAWSANQSSKNAITARNSMAAPPVRGRFVLRVEFRMVFASRATSSFFLV